MHVTLGTDRPVRRAASRLAQILDAKIIDDAGDELAISVDAREHSTISEADRPVPPEGPLSTADVHPSGGEKIVASSWDTMSGSVAASPNASCAPPASPNPSASSASPDAPTTGNPEAVSPDAQGTAHACGETGQLDRTTRAHDFDRHEHRPGRELESGARDGYRHPERTVESTRRRLVRSVPLRIHESADRGVRIGEEDDPALVPPPKRVRLIRLDPHQLEPEEDQVDDRRPRPVEEHHACA